MKSSQPSKKEEERSRAGRRWQPLGRRSAFDLSIKRRLPLLIGTLLFVIIMVSSYASYQGVKDAAFNTARERLATLITYLATQLQQQGAAMSTRSATLANDSTIRRFLESPSKPTREAAVAILKQMATAQDTNNLQIELWNAAHEPLLTIPETATPEAADLNPEFHQSQVDPFKTVGTIRIVNGGPAFPVVAAARDDSGKPLGYLVRWRKLAGAAEARKQLTDLVGNQAVLYVGNSEGDVWTDFVKQVPKPPIDLPTLAEVSHYTRDGEPEMALARSVIGTPWFVAIEFPTQPLLAQANQFLRRMIIASLFLLAIGVGAAVLLSRNISKPLQSLTQAATAIASGDYSQTVDPRRADELGALAEAFNLMVVKVRGTHRELGQKVRDRTAQLEAAAGAILMVDDHGAITMANQRAAQLFGYEPDELLGQPVEMLVPKRFGAGHPTHREGFFQHPSTRSMGAGRDLFGRRKDGSEVPIEIGLNPIQTDEGAFVFASIIDITERKRDEERFRIVVEASPSGILMIDREGLITLVNSQSEQLFGYSRSEMLGQQIEMLIPKRYRSMHPGQRLSFFEHPSARAMGVGRDLYGLRKDGSEVPIEIGLNPIETAEGAFVLASIIDISERKRSEQVLRQSEERLHTIIENLSEGLVISDLNGQLLHWNQTGLKMLDFSSMEECLLKLPEFQQIFELSTLDGAVLKLEQWPMARVIAGEHLAGYEVCVRRLGSEWKRVFSYGGAIVKEPNGQALAFVTMTDITASKQSEERLRRSQEQLAGVIGSAMDAIITIDEEQRIVLFNAAAERMFLYPAEDAIGKPLDQFIPERFRAGHQGHIQSFGKTHVTRRGMGALGALFGLRADGEEFPIEASISQIETDGQKFFTVILRDITERKRSEEALKEQARILDLAPVLIRDLNGRIIFWNTGSEQMYGWKAEEALEKTTDSLLRTEYPRAVEEIKARVLAHGHWEGELIHTRKDGQQIVVASNWVLHRDENGKPKAILEVNNDVTERKQAEHEIRRLNEELEQRVADRTAQLQAANKELEAFSYSVSHDLRAPLRHIDGFSQALLEDYTDKLDDVGKGYLREVRGASQEMAQLIDDVLQLARVTRSEMRREVVNLSDLARAIAAELKKREPKRKVILNLKEDLTTRGDRRLLRIVLNNLLGNAWKFTAKRTEGQITLGREQKNGESTYFIRDNGAGFDMAYVGKLFGAFQRLHTAGEFEGTGIGLATVQRIVYRHGGRVWAEGAVNDGATFYFTLPNSKETGDG